MINIAVDTSQVTAEFSLTKRETDSMISYIIKELCVRFAKAWADEAGRALKSARNEYQNAIVVGEEGKFKGSVTLIGQIPNMIETGAGPFDMKPGFLRSSKARNTGHSVYITIPFRFGTPTALGESKIFSGVMPLEIYAIAKNVAPVNTSLGGKLGGGGRIKVADLPDKYKIAAVRPEIITENRTFEEYKHKTSIYAGMQKSQKTYAAATSSQYITFRRVSNTGSDPNSWIHKGIQARNLAEKAIASFDIPKLVDRTADAFLSRLGF